MLKLLVAMLGRQHVRITLVTIMSSHARVCHMCVFCMGESHQVNKVQILVRQRQHRFSMFVRFVLCCFDLKHDQVRRPRGVTTLTKMVTFKKWNLMLPTQM